MSLFKKIENGIKAFRNELEKPSSFIKGEAFENYVREVVFPREHYDLVHQTHNYNTNKGDYVESSLNPDFKFRDKTKNEVFFVEAKWRKGHYNFKNKIEWCNINQLRRYQKINKETIVFIVLGFGDNPKKPEEIILFPVSSCNYTGLYDSFLDKYSFYVDRPVFSSYLWKLK